MKTNKNTTTVFLDILDSEDKMGTLSKFIKGGNYVDPNEIRFQDIIDDIKPKLLELAALEEIILQTRAWKALQIKDIKITVNNGYLYVRAPFYRRDKAAKEIRTLIGKVEDWTSIAHTSNTDDLYKFDPFMTIAYNNLTNAMSSTIMDNIETYQKEPVTS